MWSSAVKSAQKSWQELKKRCLLCRWIVVDKWREAIPSALIYTIQQSRAANGAPRTNPQRQWAESTSADGAARPRCILRPSSAKPFPRYPVSTVAWPGFEYNVLPEGVSLHTVLICRLIVVPILQCILCYPVV